MRAGRLRFPAWFLSTILLVTPCGGVLPQTPPSQPFLAENHAASRDTTSEKAAIRTYIANAWETLSRSMNDCKSVVDPKVKTEQVMYLPAGMAVPDAVTKLQQTCQVEVRRLPHAIHRIGEVRPNELPAEGLLYLPNRYVVPGGRFNEMYGWDSYFILLGLLHDGHPDVARGMVENFFFEIENYGAILNANRTYYLTRSQPPFLSSMIREVYEHPAKGSERDLKWLAMAYGYAQRDYALWTSPQHRAGDTGLARYHDLGEGPVPEMADDSTYYSDVIRWLLKHPGNHAEYLVDGPANPTAAQAAALARISCDVRASRVCAQAVVDGHRLSADFYRGDRAMRESGFDTTFRFGPFSGSTDHYAAVDLNCLLFRYEQDMAYFAAQLGKPGDRAIWKRRAAARRRAIDRYLWDAGAGLYFDYDYTKGQRSSYDFLTTFYPLWVGAANSAQASLVRSHLNLFEFSGGLAASTTDSGVQWDLPFGWAPITWIAISGLDQSGFHRDAVRIAGSFSATIRGNFLRDGTIREKYDVVRSSANVQVAAGYKSNVIGFGWTNAVYLEMQDLLQNPD